MLKTFTASATPLLDKLDILVYYDIYTHYVYVYTYMMNTYIHFELRFF